MTRITDLYKTMSNGGDIVNTQQSTFIKKAGDNNDLTDLIGNLTSGRGSCRTGAVDDVSYGAAGGHEVVTVARHRNTLYIIWKCNILRTRKLRNFGKIILYLFVCIHIHSFYLHYISAEQVFFQTEFLNTPLKRILFCQNYN